MGFFDALFGKKKKTAKYVIDKEDDQSEFLKSKDEVKSQPQKKSSQKKVDDAKETPPKKQASGKSGTKSTAESKSNVKTASSKKSESKPAEAKKAAIADEGDIDLEKSVAVKEGKETRNGKFDIRRAKDGRFFFCLYASNHAPIAYSQIYSTSNAALNGIDSIIANSPKAKVEDTTLKNHTSLPFPKWEIYIDRAGEYRFRLYATNGLCICHASHGYSTKSGCKGGMESITRFAKEAKVDKSYLN